MFLPITEKRPYFKSYSFLAIFGIFLILFLWSLFTLTGNIPSIFLPSPIGVFNALVTLFTQFDLLIDILVSIYRIMVGFMLAALIGIPLGVLLGTNRSIQGFLEPIIAFIRYIPPSAFVPLSILWFGVQDVEKFFIIFISVAPYMVLMVADRVAQVQREFIEAAKIFGANTKQIYVSIIMPYSMPGIWEVIRTLFGVSWTFIILAEIVASTSGLGHVLIQSQRFLKMENVFAVLLIIGLLGLLTDYLFKSSHKKLFPWVEKST